MSNWTKEAAEQAQDKINLSKAKAIRVKSANEQGYQDFLTIKPFKPRNSPSNKRTPKTATTVSAKPEHETEAAMAQPQRKESPIVVIGIDPGTNTGFSVVLRGELDNVETTTIFMALTAVSGLRQKYPLNSILVRFEDARLRKWFGKSGPEKWKGAGSIMRDCAIWEETLTSLGIPFEKVAPRDVKATTAEQFEKITGWKSRTSIHAREAAWLILPYLKQK